MQAAMRPSWMTALLIKGWLRGENGTIKGKHGGQLEARGRGLKERMEGNGKLGGGRVE